MKAVDFRPALRRWCVATGLVMLDVVGTAPLSGTAQQRTAVAFVSSQQDPREFVDRYCVSCHNDRAKTGGLSLQSVDLGKAAAEGGRLEKVVKKLQVGAMPPAGSPRPDAATYASLIRWLETELDQN